MPKFTSTILALAVSVLGIGYLVSRYPSVRQTAARVHLELPWSGSAPASEVSQPSASPPQTIETPQPVVVETSDAVEGPVAERLEEPLADPVAEPIVPSESVAAAEPEVPPETEAVAEPLPTEETAPAPLPALLAEDAIATHPALPASLRPVSLSDLSAAVPLAPIRRDDTAGPSLMEKNPPATWDAPETPPWQEPQREPPRMGDIQPLPPIDSRPPVVIPQARNPSSIPFYPTTGLR